MKPTVAKAIAFDLDGLMFNTEELYVDVARQMLNERGFELEMELIQQMMGRPASVAFPLMIRWYGLSDSVEALERETRDRFDGLLPTALAAMPGLLELLGELDRRNIPKAIATSSRRTYLDHVLDLASLPTGFEFTLTADDVKNGKPDPEIYLLAADRFGVNARDMLVLEDSEHGCRAAVAAGAIAVAVPAQHNQGSQYDGAALVADGLADQRIWQLLNAS